MNKFYTNWKQVMIDNQVMNGHGYFETLKQNEHKIVNLISDYENFDMFMSYYRDETEGYTEGSLRICFKDYMNSNHTYSIQLLEDPRHWGYCQCTSADDGFDPVRNCCGNGCDWTAPKISVSKTIDMVYAAFNGEEKDMWKLESGWLEEVKTSKEDEVAAQVKWFDEQIIEWQKRKEMYLQEQMKL